MNEHSPISCPVCGAQMPANAPQGLCPRCLLSGVAEPTEAGSSSAQRPAPPSLEAVRAAFPQLEVLELIGQGGMGAVFKARQPKLNRYVALKILPEALSGEPAFAERFAREAQMLARLHHPNIVTVHDFGQASGFFYLIMEYVEGVNLRQAMAAGRFTPDQALAIVPMICEALQYAHDEGVLHRDVKPENILLDTKGRVRLVDFGIAKLAAAGTSPLAGGPPAADGSLTQSGTALGTPDYMAPEQRLSPETVDARADIYSLGVVFYELLTGELPEGRFAPPSRKTPLDPRIDDVVLRALARQREKRFESAAAVKTSVEALRTQGQSGAAPLAAAGHPVKLSPLLQDALLIGFLLLNACMLYQLRVGRYAWHFWANQDVGLSARAIALAGLAGLVWLGIQVWRRRHWLLAPFQNRDLWVSVAEPPESLRVQGRARGDWLRWTCLGFIALLCAEISLTLHAQIQFLSQLMGSRVGVFGLSVAVVGAMISPVVLSILLVWFLVRRELRRENVSPPAPPPPWMPRAALLILAFALVISIPMPGGEVSVVMLGFGSLVAMAALALITRSRIWRAISIAVLCQVIIAAAVSLIHFSVLVARNQLPGEWTSPVGLAHATGLALSLQGLSLACHIGALRVLLHPRVAAAFGIRVRSQESPAAASPAMA